MGVKLKMKFVATRTKRQQLEWSLIKGGLGIVTFLIALTPTWVVVFAYHLIGPHDFWQKFAVVGFATLIAGSLQLFLLIFWVIFMVGVLSEECS